MESGIWEQRDICFCVLNDSKMTLYTIAKDIIDQMGKKKSASFLLEMKPHYWGHQGKQGTRSKLHNSIQEVKYFLTPYLISHSAIIFLCLEDIYCNGAFQSYTFCFCNSQSYSQQLIYSQEAFYRENIVLTFSAYMAEGYIF